MFNDKPLIAARCPPLRLAIFASGEGTTLAAIIDACANGSLMAEIVVVISNNRDSGVLHRARECSLPHVYLSSLTHTDPEALDAAILNALISAKAEFVVLAGFMKKIGPQVLSAYQGKIINTHPALLPKFGGPGMYGQRVHEAVLAAKEKYSGASVHLVTEEYDAGSIIAQVQVPVLAEDTVAMLSERVQTAERTLLVQTLQTIAYG